MNIPSYWAKEVQPVVRPSGRPFLAQKWGWSNSSGDDARRQAHAGLQAILRKLAAGAKPDRYGYGERPLREEIIQLNRPERLTVVIASNPRRRRCAAMKATSALLSIVIARPAKPAVAIWWRPKAPCPGTRSRRHAPAGAVRLPPPLVDPTRSR
jgi:hypothetical protein